MRTVNLKKVDFKKELKHLYQPSAQVISVVDVPPMNFLMVDGQGDPNGSEAYAHAVAALFAVSYALKFTARSELQVDYGVMPLEGLWWADDMTRFNVRDRADWQWTMTIMQPGLIDAEMVSATLAETRRKKKLPALESLRFEPFAEGVSAQLLHVGPFSEEGPSVARLHAYIEANGALSGKHHEIYLSDVTRADPARWKTVIRQPLKRAER